jgi:hypothetical protein
MQLSSNIINKVKEDLINDLIKHYKRNLETLSHNLERSINAIAFSTKKNKNQIIKVLFNKHNYIDVPLLKNYFGSQLSMLKNIKINGNNDNIDEIKEKMINRIKGYYKNRADLLTKNNQEKNRWQQFSHTKRNGILNGEKNKEFIILENFHNSQLAFMENLYKEYQYDDLSSNELNENENQEEEYKNIRLGLNELNDIESEEEYDNIKLVLNELNDDYDNCDSEITLDEMTFENVSHVETIENVSDIEKIEKVSHVETIENVPEVETIENVPEVETIENVSEVETIENISQVKMVQNEKHDTNAKYLPQIINDKIKKTYLETLAGTELDKLKTDTVTTSETKITSTQTKSIIETVTKTITTINFINEL